MDLTLDVTARTSDSHAKPVTFFDRKRKKSLRTLTKTGSLKNVKIIFFIDYQYLTEGTSRLIHKVRKKSCQVKVRFLADRRIKEHNPPILFTTP
jgi:hypothetical protein